MKKKMKTFFMLLLLICIFTSCSTMNKEYVELTNIALEEIIPRYVIYIDDDKALKAEDKKIIIQSTMEILKAVREEKKRVEEQEK